MQAHKLGTFDTVRWGQRRRLEFVELCLRWNQAINRRDLISHFQISIQQASADLAQYSRIAPENIVYDKRRKKYRPTTRFRPVLTQYDAQNYLADLAARCSGTSVPTDSFVQRPPPAEVVGTPARRVETSVLLPILAAIAHREELLASYQSMRRPGPAKVWIAPHALASDGNRWHARSWCHSTGLFRDFVLTRIQKILKSRPASMFADADCEWNTYVDLVIKPRSGLTEGQRLAIESDFAMTDGKLMIQCRQALAFYQLRNLQLDRPPDLPPADQPLDLINRDELSGIIAAARKTARGHHFSHQPESGIRL